MIKDYFFLALENLRHRGLRSWLTMLGIFIGIAAVVSLISLGNGLQETITGQFSSLSVDVLTIQNAGTGFGPPGSTAVKKLTEHDLKIIESVSGVKLAVPRLIRVVSVDYNKERQFKYITDIPEESDKMKFVYDSLGIGVEEGRLLNSNDKGKVVLGNDFLKDSFGKPIRVGSTLIINGEDFEVAGILEKASTFVVNGAILMLNDDIENLLDINSEIDLIVAQVDDKDEINNVAEEIELRLRKDRNEKIGEEDFSVQTPIQSLESVNSILTIINMIVIGIAAVSLLVGGLGL
ncbi:ABC transporter permease [Candidatus Pacearchaeota archaeon]|nr:ABC transporter permease [Candidatus Pacearchaeota archaeon]